jgi:hypothetical protein
MLRVLETIRVWVMVTRGAGTVTSVRTEGTLVGAGPGSAVATDEYGSASAFRTSPAVIGLTVRSVIPAPSTEIAAVPAPIAAAAVAAQVAKASNVRRVMGMDCAMENDNGRLRRK